MKQLLIATAFIFTLSAQANGEYKPYLVTYITGNSWTFCYKTICSFAKAYGDGTCKRLGTYSNTIKVNLTTYGAEGLRQISSCQFAVESEGTVYTQPKFGVSN